MRGWTAACQASNLARLTAPKSSAAITTQPSKLIHRRGFAAATDHHGHSKVNFWQDPIHPSRWKTEHFVIVSLAGCGLLVYGGYKMLSGDEKDMPKERDGNGSH